MTDLTAGKLAALAVTVVLVMSACSSSSSPDDGAQQPTVPGAQTSTVGQVESTPAPVDEGTGEPTPHPDDGTEPAQTTDAPIPDPATDGRAPTSTPATAPTPGTAPAAPAVPSDKEPPEPAFTSDEAAALSCANLENGLRALELGDLPGVRSALVSAADYVAQTESAELRSLAQGWLEIDGLDQAEPAIWDGLRICEQLGYSL